MSFQAGTTGPSHEIELAGTCVERSPRRGTLLAVSDPKAAGILSDAVREALPGAVLHLAQALLQARLMLVSVRPDLVLIDLNMADAVLRDFIAEAASRNPRTKVVVVAGHGDDDGILPALHGGAAGFVSKHDPAGTIAQQLRDAMSGVLPLSPSLARRIIRHLDRTGPGGDLSGPELEMLTWVAAADTPAQAAQRLRIDQDGARACINRIYEKLRLASRPGPVAPRAKVRWGNRGTTR